METNHKIAIGIAIAAVLAIIYYFVFWFEPALTSGEIIDIQTTQNQTSYEQLSHSVYRYVTKHRWVTKDVKDSDGHKTGTKRVEEEYRDRVFDHYEYYIMRYFNGADTIVTIQAPASKHPENILTAKIYVSAHRLSDLNLKKGDVFNFDKNAGDNRCDTNNTEEEVARRAYDRFDLDSWIVEHDPKSIARW